ncbi:hypothetical protein NUW54_g10298 [Trametes sanguinea]|uniref:Uncharacterized protein n=1 Tax=Trametes sanguinea TaxID=158606 RepID=A0ACC1P028_9APHY|nr:hypothetical protein NUW54_g10298 [Trametes sanguinea]
MTSSGQPSKVSFTIRRPTPATRTESDSDSSFKVPAVPRHLSGTSTPNSPLARSAPASPKRNARTYVERDSSDEDSEPEDELVTGFDEFGIKRCVPFPLPLFLYGSRNSQQPPPMADSMRSRSRKARW